MISHVWVPSDFVLSDGIRTNDYVCDLCGTVKQLQGSGKYFYIPRHKPGLLFEEPNCESLVIDRIMNS